MMGFLGCIGIMGWVSGHGVGLSWLSRGTEDGIKDAVAGFVLAVILLLGEGQRGFVANFLSVRTWK